MAIASKNGSAQLVIERIQIQEKKVGVAHIHVVGITPYLMHSMSEENMDDILDRQQAGPLTRKTRKKRDPQEDYLQAQYLFEDGRYGIPATAFKSAIVDGCLLAQATLPTTIARRIIFVVGEGVRQLVPLRGVPEFDRRHVRLANGSTDLRFRPIFFPWAASLEIRFNANILTNTDVANLVNYGGDAGVGDYRPSSPKSRSGIYGMFEVHAERVSKV